MLKTTAFTLCLALMPLTLSGCFLFTEDVRADVIQLPAATFLPTADDICRYVQEKAPERDLSALRALLAEPEREIVVAGLAPMLDWVLPLYVSLIDSDPDLSLNAKEGRKLTARALETSLNRILER